MDDISDLNTDDDYENENDLVDHDDPPYQDPPHLWLFWIKNPVMVRI